MALGINANVVHGWRKLAREGGGLVAVVTSPAFLTVIIESALNNCLKPKPMRPDWPDHRQLGAAKPTQRPANAQQKA